MIIQHQPGSGGQTTFNPYGSSQTYLYGGGQPGADSLYAQPGQFANSMSNAYQGMSGAVAGLGQGMGQAAAGAGSGIGSGVSGLAQGFGNLGAGMAGAASQHSGALAGLGSAMANNYGAYAGSLAGMANAQANERAAAYAAMAQSEAARQMAAGNIANQALAGYGALGNAAMNAWGQNQSAYNQALSNMFAANQGAASQLGQSRNQALAGLGTSTASLGRGLAAAGAIGGMGSPGESFVANSPQGQVASGSFNAGMSPGYAGSVSGQASVGAMDQLRQDVMDNSVLDNLTAGRDQGMTQLDAQHYSSRNAPLSAFQDSLGGFRQLAGDGYGQLGSGMSQFYGNMNANRADFSPMLRGASQGYYTSANDIRQTGGRMSDDFRYGMGQASNVIPEMRRVGDTLGTGVGGIMGGMGGMIGSALTSLNDGMQGTQGAISDLWGNTLGGLFGNQGNERQRIRNRIESLGGTYFG